MGYEGRRKLTAEQRRLPVLKSTIVLAIALTLLCATPPCLVRAETASTLSRLEFHTPSDLGLDIVFVPEDYGANDLGRYRETVERCYHALLSIQPFLRYRNVINVWRIDTTVDFGAERRYPNIPRLLTVNDTKVRAFVKSMINIDLDFKPPDDQIIVLVNTPEYGGSGGNPSVAYAGGEWSVAVMVHEFGHAFGDLGDEYVVYDEDYPAGRVIPYPNIDWDGSKWKGVPGTGAYLGAWYRNLVRPTEENCIMRTVAYLGFCPVCESALAIRLEYYSPPIGLTLRVYPNIAGIKVKINASSYTTDDRGEVSVTLGRRCYSIALDDMCQASEFVRYSFRKWEDGSTSSNRTLYLASNTTITAFYQLQYVLQLKNQYDVSASLSGAGWYDAGSIATISIGNTTVTKGGTRYVFRGWSGNVTATSPTVAVLMDNYKIVTANWLKQFYVEVVSSHGSAGGSGWYNESSIAKISIDAATIREGSTRYVFAGWPGGYRTEKEFSIRVDEPKTVTALWETEYYLEVITEHGEVAGADWYAAGSTAAFSLKSESLPVEGLQGTLGARYVFEGWTGDYVGKSPSGFLVMDRPHTVVAAWRTDYTLLYLNVGIIVSVVATVSILAYTLHKRRGRQPPSSLPPPPLA